MKKIYNLVLVAGLSILAVGAGAQSAAKFKKFAAKPIKASNRFATHVGASNTVKKAQGANQDAVIDYLAGDQLFASGGTFYFWQPVLSLNAAYTIADTGSAYNLASNYAAVTFDTIFDLYSNNFISPVGGVTIDTIAAEIQYHNTSGLNDTIIFNVCAVTAKGFLNTAVIYGADTAIITPTTFSAGSNTLDSTQFFFLNDKNFVIPSSARSGYNFAIQMTVKGPKIDTIAPLYYSQGSSACSAAGEFTPASTLMGVSDGAQRNVNSFVYGMYYQNDKANSGNNTALLWPTTSGKYAGYCINGGGSYSSPLPLALVGFSACTGDTNWFSVQDIAIYPSVSISPAGVNNLTSNGLNVGQNFPNPANNATQINYSVTKSSDVTFTVNDITGREIMNNTYSNVAPGQHVVSVSTANLNDGIYFYTFNVNGNKVTKKMVVTK